MTVIKFKVSRDQRYIEYRPMGMGEDWYHWPNINEPVREGEDIKERARLLNIAYNEGIEDAKREIRHALGVRV